MAKLNIEKIKQHDDSNYLANDYKTYLCRIGCSNTGLDLSQEIEVDKPYENT